jgi:hypothetical protein
MANNGNYQALYVNGQRIALTKSNDFNAKKAFADITTKDSQGNKEVLPTLNECSATLEGIATSSLVNKLQFPENLDNAIWTKSGTGTFSGTKVNSPFLQKLAQVLTWGTTTLVRQTMGTVAVGTYTLSIYAKGSGTFALEFLDDTNTITSGTFTLTSDWQRFEVSGALTTGLSTRVNIKKTTGTDITLFGPQLEVASAATMYRGSQVTFSDLQTIVENNTKVTIIQSDYIDGDIQVTYEGYISDLQIKSTHDEAETFTCNFEGTGVQTSSTI